MKSPRTLSRAVRWTRDEWARIRRQARAEGSTPSEVIRTIVGMHLQLQSEGFETMTTAEVRAVVEQLRIARAQRTGE